jgi:hypothetical protein
MEGVVRDFCFEPARSESRSRVGGDAERHCAVSALLGRTGRRIASMSSAIAIL